MYDAIPIQHAPKKTAEGRPQKKRPEFPGDHKIKAYGLLLHHEADRRPIRGALHTGMVQSRG